MKSIVSVYLLQMVNIIGIRFWYYLLCKLGKETIINLLIVVGTSPNKFILKYDLLKLLYHEKRINKYNTNDDISTFTS